MEEDQEPKSKPLLLKWFIKLASNFLILAVVLIGVDLYRIASKSYLNVDAPPFELGYLLQPSQQKLPEANSVNIFYFSAPWCGVCGFTGKNLQYATTLLETFGFQVRAEEISLAYASREGLLKYSNENAGKDFLVGNDPLMEQYGVSSFPTFFFIGKDGKVKQITVGYTTSIGLAARAILSHLI